MNKFNFGEHASSRGVEPSVAGVLSLVPGLGQFYNGDRLKGWLFLEVGMVNFTILALILCAEPLTSGLSQFAVHHHFQANYALLKQLGSFKLGHPGATLLFALCVAFIAFAVRDAYDRATNIKNREIYKGHFLELSEATSGSYLAHFALMGALLLLSVFLLIPAPPRTQVTEIEFVNQDAQHLIKPPVTHRISKANTAAQGEHKANLKVQQKQGAQAQSQASASRSSQQKTSVAKPQTKPEAKTHSEDAPKPAPIKAAETPKPPAPLPVVRPPVPHVGPTPVTLPMPMPARPTPVASKPAPTPMASTPRPMPNAAAATSVTRPNTAAPMPYASGMAAPKPLLAFKTSDTAAAVPALPGIQPTVIGTGSFANPNHSWMSGKSSNGGGKTGSAALAPSVDTSSIGGTGDGHAKPTLADASTGRGGTGRHPGRDSSGPAPTAARSTNGFGSGPSIIVPHTGTGSGNQAAGVPNGGRTANPDEGAAKGPTAIATGGNPEFGGYLAELQRRIRRAWYPPHQPTSRSTIIVFTIGVNGELLKAHMQRSSGDAAMDDAAMQAIRNSAPFRHLPQFATEPVDVQFTFDYNVFNRGRF